MEFQFSLALIIIFTFSIVSPSQSSSMAKPGCDATCGNITVPFPFGTTSECYHSMHFWVTCNRTFSPPKLFWQNNTDLEINNITLDGQFILQAPIAHDCYDNGISVSNVSSNTPGIVLTDYSEVNNTPNNLTDYFTVNNTANKLTVVGCDSYAFVHGWRLDRNFTTGCVAFCESEQDLNEVAGSCTGVGCCQTSIPKNAWMVQLELLSFGNYTDVDDFNDCGYAFVAEQNAFNFSAGSLTSLKEVTTLPMVVDWVIGRMASCKVAMDSTTYACVNPNTECDDSKNGYGYRCRCSDGYEGNPYLSDGCRDVDECKIPNLRKCKHNCVNIPGNYTCPCPKGYHGDGMLGGEGCRRGESLILRLVAGIAIGTIGLLLLVILLYLELKRRQSKKTKQKHFLQNGGTLLQQKLNSREGSSQMVRIFTSSELQKATDDFHNSMIIGQGGFGTVYKGLLQDSNIVAIKKSKKVDPGQIEQFINEVFVLSQVNHKNVVRLIGCCLETEVPLLVYEFINNGTLSSHIHNQTNARLLNWEMRLKIAAETAGVLAYLHSSASTPIIHRDVKPDNILLDHTFTAKVSDFGASRLVPQDLTQLSTMVQGTFGYLDPEYLQTNQLTEKSDVYSFGVVLLELITGRKAISFDKIEQEKNLANYFLHVARQERLCEIVDGNIAGNGNMEMILEVSRIARGCLNVRGEDRPSMKEVAMELEGMILGGKQTWMNNAECCEEEMECLLGECVGGDAYVADGDGNSVSVGYDSLRSHILLPMTGGR